MSSKAWIKEFLKFYADWFNPHDWPEGAEARAWRNEWVKLLDRAGVTDAEARDATRHLAQGDPERRPRYRADHLPALLRAVRHLRGGVRYDGAALAQRQAERDREQAQQDAWQALPEADRARWVADLANRFPRWQRFPAMYEVLGRLEFAGEDLGPPEPYDPPRPAPPRSRRPHLDHPTPTVVFGPSGERVQIGPDARLPEPPSGAGGAA